MLGASMGFVGEIPLSIRNLTGLTDITLSRNSLYGEFPDVFDSLSNVKTLILARNFFSGKIPPTIGSLGSKLTTLQLYTNHFSGTVPASFNNLVSLEWIMLHDNYLTGTFLTSNFPTMGGFLSCYDNCFDSVTISSTCTTARSNCPCSVFNNISSDCTSYSSSAAPCSYASTSGVCKSTNTSRTCSFESISPSGCSQSTDSSNNACSWDGYIYGCETPSKFPVCSSFTKKQNCQDAHVNSSTSVQCWWNGVACFNTHYADCSSFSSSLCDSAKMNDTEECAYTGSVCAPLSSLPACSSYSNQTNCESSYDSSRSLCVWSGGSCITGSQLQDCTAYSSTNETTCTNNKGTNAKSCLWNGKGCYSYLPDCIYINPLDCNEVVNSLSEKCWFDGLSCQVKSQVKNCEEITSSYYCDGHITNTSQTVSCAWVSIYEATPCVPIQNFPNCSSHLSNKLCSYARSQNDSYTELCSWTDDTCYDFYCHSLTNSTKCNSNSSPDRIKYATKCQWSGTECLPHDKIPECTSYNTIGTQYGCESHYGPDGIQCQWNNRNCYARNPNCTDLQNLKDFCDGLIDSDGNECWRNGTTCMLKSKIGDCPSVTNPSLCNVKIIAGDIAESCSWVGSVYGCTPIGSFPPCTQHNTIPECSTSQISRSDSTLCFWNGVSCWNIQKVSCLNYNSDEVNCKKANFSSTEPCHWSVKGCGTVVLSCSNLSNKTECDIGASDGINCTWVGTKTGCSGVIPDCGVYGDADDCVSSLSNSSVSAYCIYSAGQCGVNAVSYTRESFSLIGPFIPLGVISVVVLLRFLISCFCQSKKKKQPPQKRRAPQAATANSQNVEMNSTIATKESENPLASVPTETPKEKAQSLPPTPESSSVSGSGSGSGSGSNSGSASGSHISSRSGSVSASRSRSGSGSNDSYGVLDGQFVSGKESQNVNV
eukprot:TRINITY_DN3499_c0_g1_i7.p1 TRINITY_DN3499_c0_g1~~TRINITY_DN3499_c0_g1_i7.p1  ORF type:complete len:1004 (+),score=177.95 TRINITY_DN3499_c0_g1_i7:214-3012(+)